MNNKQQAMKPRTRLSFILRDKNEFYHSKGINSLTMGRAYDRNEGSRTVSCRHLMSGGRDGKIRLWEAQHSRGDSGAAGSAGGANPQANVVSDQIVSGGATGTTSFSPSNPLGHSNPRMATTQAASIGGG